MIASDEQLAGPTDLAISTLEAIQSGERNSYKTFLSNRKGMTHIYSIQY